MRTMVAGVLLVVIIGFVGCAVWWNSSRFEAWADETKHEWKNEQERQQVKHAETFLRKGFAELDREIERLENVRYEHRVAGEEARLRAVKVQNAMTKAEELTVEFLKSQKAGNSQSFDFYGRRYDSGQAEQQFDAFSRELLAHRQTLDELRYDEVSHRQAAEYIASAIKTLKETRGKAQREGNRLLIDRDVADARALSQALSPASLNPDRQLGSTLATTLNLLREYLNRRNAESMAQQPSGVASVDDTCQRKSDLLKKEELERLKDDLRQMARRAN